MAVSASEARHDRHAVLSQQNLLGLILAGGQARRMGGQPKGLMLAGGQTILSRVRRVLEPACARLLISVGAGGASWAEHADAAGLDLLPDDVADSGPLAALARVATVAEGHGFAGVVTAPWDCPFLPVDLVARLMEAANKAGCSVYAEDQVRSHPALALWRVPDLQRIAGAFLSGERRLHESLQLVDAQALRFADAEPPPFFNLNTPEDLDLLQRWCNAHDPA